MKIKATCLCLLSLPVFLCWGVPLESDGHDQDVMATSHSHHHRNRRSTTGWPTLTDRENCEPGDPVPPTRVNTTQRLADLRAELVDQGLHAFIVLSNDAHGLTSPAESERRIAFISGFTGSAGSAAITRDKAALWTDGRYFLEGEQTLDCNWIFMKSGLQNVPSLLQWLAGELQTGAVVGADPFLLSNQAWTSYSSSLASVRISLNATMTNPLDVAWGDARPPSPNTTINALPLRFAGKQWQHKIDDLRLNMQNMDVGAFVVTSLDETAWLFNLRANDVQDKPFFLSYAVVTNSTISLYILDKDRRLTTNPSDIETDDKLHVHLNTGETGSCLGMSGYCVEVHDYNGSAIVEDISRVAATQKVWVTHYCNYAIFGAIPEIMRVQYKSSIALDKSQKNDVERQGMLNCYNRDSAVLIEFLAMMDKEIKAGNEWTEVSAATRLREMREAAEYNRGLSFPSISGSGPNGAIIHYSPSEITDRPITTSEMYLLDSGGQYLDGTTDVTRTMHYGTPSDKQRECYTRVLMGATDLASMIWPVGLYGREIDMSARAPLWAAGLDYRHGTGHGIGAYLSVHEGPGNIGLSHYDNPSEETIRAYMFFSDEPGYYEDGEFGIRLETIVMVEPYNTTYKFGNTDYLSFKPITLVPFEPHLIDYDMLSQKQIDWLNEYNRLTWEEMSGRVSEEARSWLYERTRTITLQRDTSSATAPTNTLFSVALATILALLAV